MGYKHVPKLFFRKDCIVGLVRFVARD
jgi:hypothetical protein